MIVTDELPDDVDFVSAVASSGTFTAVAGTVTWNLGTVAVADPPRTLQITVFVHPDAASPLVNNAAVSSTTSDPNTANNLATWTVALTAEAGLTLTKTDSPDPVTAGANLTYTLKVTNGGPSTAVDVVVTDTLPAGTTLVSAVGGTGTTACAEVALGIVSCEIGDLDPGESETIFITVKVASSVPDGTVLHNTAEATSPTDPDGAQASADTTVIARADLWMEKTGTAPRRQPGRRARLPPDRPQPPGLGARRYPDLRDRRPVRRRQRRGQRPAAADQQEADRAVPVTQLHLQPAGPRGDLHRGGRALRHLGHVRDPGPGPGFQRDPHQPGHGHQRDDRPEQRQQQRHGQQRGQGRHRQARQALSA